MDGIRLHPMTGWPFPFDVLIAYALGDEGLSVETRALNIGERACPFACGQHPYLSPGGGHVDACTLELRARTRILTDLHAVTNLLIEGTELLLASH